MEILSFLGEYTWELVPVSIRSFLFWLIIISYVGIFIFCIWSLPKTNPDNVSPTLTLSGAPGATKVRILSQDEIVTINKGTVNRLAVIGWILLLFAMLRLVGSVVFEKHEVSGKTVKKDIPVTQQVWVGDTVYTCTKKTYVNVFVTQGQHGEIAKGSSMTVISPRSTTKVPTWWGEQEYIRQDTIIYTCGG